VLGHTPAGHPFLPRDEQDVWGSLELDSETSTLRDLMDGRELRTLANLVKARAEIRTRGNYRTAGWAAKPAVRGTEGRGGQSLRP
jgi:hypothetical protein